LSQVAAGTNRNCSYTGSLHRTGVRVSVGHIRDPPFQGRTSESHLLVLRGDSRGTSIRCIGEGAGSGRLAARGAAADRGRPDGRRTGVLRRRKSLGPELEPVRLLLLLQWGQPVVAVETVRDQLPGLRGTRWCPLRRHLLWQRDLLRRITPGLLRPQQHEVLHHRPHLLRNGSLPHWLCLCRERNLLPGGYSRLL
jgi:hypothetical protein